MVYLHNNQTKSNQTEIRKLQGIHGNSTYTIVLPKDFISILKLSKGDYLKCRVSNQQLIIEKAEV
jgi:antitoxin component of MazEF toxin-antitoxin module